MMCGKSVRASFIYRKKRGKMEKRVGKRGETGEWKKIEKQIKIRRYHICGKMEKNQENERIIIDEMAFYAYNKIRCLKNNMSIFI